MGKDLLRGEGTPQIDISVINEYLEGVTAAERIKWAVNTVGISRVVLTTSGGLKAPLLPDYVKNVLGVCPPVIFVDTRLYSIPTLGMVDYLESEGYDIRDYLSPLEPEDIELLYPGWTEPGSPNFDDAVEHIKLEPVAQAFRELLPGDKPAVWIRGISRYQSQERADTPVIRYINGIYQLHPIVDWTEDVMDRYLVEHDLPTNPWHVDITKGEFNLECGIGNIGLSSPYTPRNHQGGKP